MKSPPVSSRLKSKKNSASSIDTKFKIVAKGNMTERNMQRVNTQYEDFERGKPQNRLNTQYEKVNNQYDRLSPSFYKLSAD